MSTVLISGGAGFAGRHLVDRLREDGYDPVAPSRAELDFLDSDAVRATVARSSPAAVIHLAALSSPSQSWERPADAVLGNVEMTINLLEAVAAEAPEATVVLIGSGQVYGEPRALPATEESPIDPRSPYAVSKATADMLGRVYGNGGGLRIVRLRPFNHAGPGQDEEYVVSALVRQVAEAEVAGGECTLRTGNPEVARDFTDVRDVVRAYVAAIDLRSGAFNVCSGRPAKISEIIEIATAAARVPVRHEVEQGRLRAVDAPILYGSHDRLTKACGWLPEITLEQTVLDTLEWWRRKFDAS